MPLFMKNHTVDPLPRGHDV